MWPDNNIPKNNTSFDDETWREIVVNSRRKAEKNAVDISKKTVLTQDDRVWLAVNWCCGNLPYPPIHYYPKEQAREFVRSLGLID